MHFSSRINRLLGYETFASDDKNIPYKLAEFVNSAKETLFIVSDFLDPDLFNHRAVLDALGNANMRKVDIRIVVGFDYHKVSAGIIDGSLGGVLINIVKDGLPVKHSFIVADERHVWLENTQWNYMMCRMNDRNLARPLSNKFLIIFGATQSLLLEPTKIPI